jgi:hypothetical protein
MVVLPGNGNSGCTGKNCGNNGPAPAPIVVPSTQIGTAVPGMAVPPADGVRTDTFSHIWAAQTNMPVLDNGIVETLSFHNFCCYSHPR